MLHKERKSLLNANVFFGDVTKGQMCCGFHLLNDLFRSVQGSYTSRQTKFQTFKDFFKTFIMIFKTIIPLSIQCNTQPNKELWVMT